ncbi:hypothetical protein D3C87_130410 [compost metagenome]
MKFHQRKVLVEDEFQLASCNTDNPNYISFPTQQVDLLKVKDDLKLLLEFRDKYLKRVVDIKTPVVGDCIFLPDGQVVYFCSIYETKGQTCESGSFSLSNNGFLSYSGGLDTGILFSDLVPTKELYILPIWFCHKGYLCAGSAVYANIECRVWKTKSDADLSGIPQVKRLRKLKLKEQSETITKVDSIGNTFQEHLPALIIIKEGLPEGLIDNVREVTGLVFEDSYHFVSVYWSQPMTVAQLELIQSFRQFMFKETYDQISHEPLLILSISKD